MLLQIAATARKIDEHHIMMGVPTGLHTKITNSLHLVADAGHLAILVSQQTFLVRGNLSRMGAAWSFRYYLLTTEAMQKHQFS